MNGIVDMFYYSFTVNMIAVPLLVIFIVIVGKPLFVLFKAKITGRTLFLVGRKDRKLDFMTVKYEGGLGRSKKYGDYLIVPDSIYTTTSGVSCGLVFEPYGVTLPKEFIDATSTLRDMGIQRFDEMEKSKEVLDKQFKTEGNPKLLSPEEQKLIIKARLMAENRMTKSIDSVTNFFKYHVNPHSIRSAVNRSVAEVVEQYHKTDWAKITVMIVIILIGGALAYFIISSGIAQQPSPIQVPNIPQPATTSPATPPSQGGSLT